MQISKSQTIDLLLEGKSVFIDGEEIRYNKSNSMIQCRSENRGHKWINSPFWLSNLLACKTCEVFGVNRTKDNEYKEARHDCEQQKSLL